MKKIIKNPIFTFALGATLFGTVSTVFAYSVMSSNVGYIPKDTLWNVNNVATALDELRTTTTNYVYGSSSSSSYGTWQSIELGFEPRIVVFIGPTSGGFLRSYIYIKGASGTAYSRGSQLYTETTSAQLKTYDKGFKWYVKDSSWKAQTIYYYAFK